MASTGSDRADIRRRNRSAIRRYITHVREARHKGRYGIGGGGISKYYEGLPISDPGLNSIDNEDNRFAAKLVNPLIEEWLRYKHPSSYFVVEEASLNHAHWEDERTAQDKKLNSLFKRALTRLEAELNRRYPGVEITVKVSPKARRLQSKYQERDLQRVDQATYGTDGQDGYVVIVKRLEQIMLEHPTYTKQRARQVLSNRMAGEQQPYCSVALIRKAEARVKEMRAQGIPLELTG